MPDPLSQFHPLVEGWFRETLGEATDVQRQAWPKIARGEHLLITAPTGSGKTLTAFLWAIDRFITGDLERGQTRVLYVSPLKALNNDIQRNLTGPLEELGRRFAEAGETLPRITATTRSGDTDPFDRRRMIRHPPEILITTPESLNLLLSSAGGRTLLTGLETVILDEIHSLVDNKRGAYLMSAVERLVLLSGEFQRLALSATVNPLETVARMVGGYRLDTTKPDYLAQPRYDPRAVTIVESAQEKRYSVTIRYPEESARRPPGEKIWETLGGDFASRIAANRATLLFTNSRVLCEKLTHKINEAAGDVVAYSHHGSLAREIRTAVEARLKQGELKAIVATSSLEMGIDVGTLDEVLLVQCPPSISSAVQRIGRAGHRVGEVSRGTIYPTHPQDFMEAAVLAAAIREGAIEPLAPVLCPLDVLAQVIVSMVAMEAWDLDALYLHLRCSYSFQRLSRTQFDLVVNMLAGRYADTRVQELKPRVSIDRLDNSVSARPGSLQALYLSGGVIPDRGYYQLRHEESDARLGELDEEFVWEARPGQIFTLGTQQWQIQRITHNDVRVIPARRTTGNPPFWKAESQNRDFHFSERIGRFLEEIDPLLDDDETAMARFADLDMDRESAQTLLAFLRLQREHARCSLPHRHNLVVEHAETLPGRASGRQTILHTFWGARVNRPFALALEAAWEEEFGAQVETYVNNDCVVLQMPHAISAAELFSLVPAERIDALLRRSLEGSGFFAARFRECAGRALLLSRKRFNERKPLWMSRLQSQKLMDAVRQFEDFPILLESWRTCLQDEFDLVSLRLVVDEIASGATRVSETVSASPSPMAHNISWNQINLYMYQEDRTKGSAVSGLRQSLLEELLHAPELRPAIPPELVEQFEQRRKRLTPGYAPQSGPDLRDWLIERVAVPVDEWREVVRNMERDEGADLVAARLAELEARAIIVRRGAAELVVPLDHLAAVAAALYGVSEPARELDIYSLDGVTRLTRLNRLPEPGEENSAATWIGNWLQSFGPITGREIARMLGADATLVERALVTLQEDESIVSGLLVAGRDELTVCDRGNLEALLRMVRQLARPVVEPLELAHLPALLWRYHGEGGSADEQERLYAAVESLRCYPAPANLWEQELLPARVDRYKPALLDQLFQQGRLHWIGRKEHQLALCFGEDLDLVAPAARRAEDEELARLLPDPLGRYGFESLTSRVDWPLARIVDLLWRHSFDGAVSNDSFAAMRQGIECGFLLPAGAALARSEGARTGRAALRRGAFASWQRALPYSGNWYRLQYPPSPADPLEEEEINKERVRVLLDRYGILFRELLQREAPPFRWPNLFRSLRLMEMSGEVLSGYFFKGIPGPQFVSPRMYRLLQVEPDEPALFWLNAADPLSLCGTGLEALKGELPRRIPSNHLVYRGEELALVSRRNGADLDFRIAPDDSDMPRCLALLRHLLYRPQGALRHIRIESINGKPASRSPYVEPLRTSFDAVSDYRHVTLHRQL